MKTILTKLVAGLEAQIGLLKEIYEKKIHILQIQSSMDTKKRRFESRRTDEADLRKLNQRYDEVTTENRKLRMKLGETSGTKD
jgi:hypothetical protein